MELCYQFGPDKRSRITDQFSYVTTEQILNLSFRDFLEKQVIGANITRSDTKIGNHGAISPHSSIDGPHPDF